MHIENELAEIVTTGEHEFEEIIEQYEEEILVQEVPEPPLTNAADTAPTQGKPQCITLIFDNHRIYICCAFTLQEFYGNHMHIYLS
jgi:hypothetical protein